MKKRNLKANSNVIYKKTSLTLRLWNIIYPYRKVIVFSILALLIAGLILGGWFSYQEWCQKKAVDLLEVAKEGKDYENLIKNYSGTSAAVLAMISLGELKWKEGQYSKAREIYELFLEKYPNHMFASLVKNLQGECLLQEKKLLEAESIFNLLLNTPQDLYIQSLAQMNLGRVIMAKGDSQKAIDLFKNFKQEKSQMLWTDVLDAFIRRQENSKNVQN